MGEDNIHDSAAAQSDKKSVLKEMICSFTDHPKLADETYFQHLLFTLGMAGRLLICASALLIHGIFPFLFVHTTSHHMGNCQKILDERAQKTACPNKNQQ